MTSLRALLRVKIGNKEKREGIELCLPRSRNPQEHNPTRIEMSGVGLSAVG